MKENDSYKIFNIERPFYFLCGPNVELCKKRDVLLSFLKKKYVKKPIRPYPIIVDKILSTPLIDEYHLDLVLLEEIVAAISLRTYIFLDSLSTAYELGLFKNSKSNNNVRILVESTFGERKRRDVGIYIKKSIDKGNFLHYEATSLSKEEEEKEHFEFKDGKVSKEIADCIENEMAEYAKNVETISIVNKNNDGNPNNIYVQLNQHQMKVSFSLKSLFYMIQAYLRYRHYGYKKRKEIDDKKLRILLKDFCLFIKREVLLGLGNVFDKTAIFDDLDIEISQFEKTQVTNIIRHIYFFNVLLSQYKGSLHTTISSKDAFHDAGKLYVGHYLDFGEIFGLNKIKTDKTINSYLANPDDYVDSVSYVINKKIRKIYKYKDNYKGRQLRYIHEKIVDMFELILPSSQLSFAYKNGQNTLKCISQHKESRNFLKLDIHHYFESIKCTQFIKEFYKQIKRNLKANGIKDDECYGIDLFKIYIKCLFYKGHIPLGFVSSPKVSDFYLKSIDDWASKLKVVKYSRYADDILMSTKDINYSFSNIKASFEKRIDKKGLAINPDKVINKKLINNGDCIKFLGICLVKKDNENEVRISKRYLKEVVKECYKAKEKDVLKDEQIMGKIRYIKLISEQSYERLLKALSSNEKGSYIASTIKYLLE